MREKILSIPLHLADLHKFPNNEAHKECCHEDLTGADRSKPWLAEGSKVIIRARNRNNIIINNAAQELTKLSAALAGKNDSRLNDLEMLTGGNRFNI